MATRTIRPVSAATSRPRLILHDVTFSSGGATVTAVSIGMTKILGIAAIPWGVTAAHAASIHSTTAFTEHGVTSVALRHVETVGADAGAPDAIDTIVPILFIGE